MSLFGIVSGIGAIAGLFKKDKTAKAIREATRAQIAAQERGMQIYEQLMREAMRNNLATSIASSQAQYDLARMVNAQNQAAQMPYQMARLSALQALPQMQQLLGVNAYAIPTTVRQSQLPEMDMAAIYQATQNRLGTEGNAYRNAAIAAGADPAKLGYTGMPYMGSGTYPGSVVSQMVNQEPTEFTLKQLQPTRNLEYAIQASPLYKWQLGEATRGLNNQLAAAGLSSSTYAQRELGRRAESLAAQERERQIANLQWLTQQGLGGQPMSGTMATPNIGSLGQGQSELMGQLASGLASGYSAQGAAAAQGAMNLANYQASKPDPFGQLLSAAYMFGGGGGRNGGWGRSTFNPMAAYQMGMLTNPNPMRLF